jgi:hypothetical protein
MKTRDLTAKAQSTQGNMSMKAMNVQSKRRNPGGMGNKFG